MPKGKSAHCKSKRKAKVQKAKARARGYYRKRKSGGRLKKHRAN